MTSASSSRSDAPVPAPPAKPPCLLLPAVTISMLEPSPAIDADTSFCTPPPIASIRITAATPMIMPSMVSAERSRLATSADHASASIEAIIARAYEGTWITMKPKNRTAASKLRFAATSRQNRQGCPCSSYFRLNQ